MIIGLENQLLVFFFYWSLKTGFTVCFFFLQVRDVLKGTLKFSQTLADEDGSSNISIDDNHYDMEDEKMSPDSEISPENVVRGKDAEKKRMFYMSSEENSEAMESPSEANIPTGTLNTFKLPASRDYELRDYKSDNSSASQGREEKLHSGGPNVVESELSKSWSPDSERTTSSLESDFEESPNPLYRIRHGSYNL